MALRNPCTRAAVICGLVCCPESLSAQQVTVTTPMQSVGDRFFESTNVNWSFGVRSGPRVKVFGRFGSPAAVAPPFGRFNPNAGIRGGFAVQGGDFGARLGFNFAQGAGRTFTTVAPKITLMNGQPGFLFIGRQVPFVTGVVPVIGSAGRAMRPKFTPADTVAAQVLRGELKLPDNSREATRSQMHQFTMPTGDVQRARSSSPITALPGPNTLRRQRQAERAADLQKARTFLKRGREAEAKGKPQVAQHYYRLAARKADGRLKHTILARLAALESR